MVVSKCWRKEKLEELEVCQPAIFVAAMCGLEWLKDQEQMALFEPLFFACRGGQGQE